MFAFIVIVSVWTPLEFERIGQRWFSWPNILYLSPVPAATAFFVWACWRGLHRSRFMFSPFYSAVALFIIAYVGLVISTFPYIVPPSITVWDAAAAASSQRFVLIGIAILFALHSRLHGIRVLHVSRQGARRRGLPPKSSGARLDALQMARGRNPCAEPS